MTVAAVPVPAPVPPICEVAPNDMVSDVSVAVPVVSNKEPEFNVNGPVPPFTVKLPVPELTIVLAASVTPAPVKEIAIFVVLIPALTANAPVAPTVNVPAPPVIAPLTVRAPVLLIFVVPPPA